VAAVVLAGGMATRFGGVVKAAVEVARGKTFLDLKLADIRATAARSQGHVPVYLMTRPATDADVTRIAELCRQALAEMAPARGGAVFVAREARPEPLEEGLAAPLADEAQRVWVGTIDDVVIAYAVAGVERLRTGAPLGVIDDIYVEAEARGVGVGEGLMNAALAWLEAEGCSGVDARALPGDRATKNFFEGSGFSARLLVMHHRIDR